MSKGKLVPKIDCHIHTNFSMDGKENPEDVVLKAIDLGLSHICITDHMDIFYSDPTVLPFNLRSYTATLQALKQKYAHKIYLAVGLEVGFTKKNALENKKKLSGYTFDYIIDSVHDVGDSDCYMPSHFSGADRNTIYAQYLQAVLQSLDVPYLIHTVGHLGYIFRNAPYAQKLITDNAFDALLNVIFAKILARGVILELNTSTYGLNSATLPNVEILKKYREAGGKKICFSSDAHNLSRIAEGYEAAAQNALDCGFTYWTVIQNNKEVRFEI